MPSDRLVPVGFQAGGHRFHALTAGQAGRPLLLFLHGFPEYSGAWAEILPRLTDHWYCVAPDQRGYGRSWRPEGAEHYKVSALVADAAAAIAHFSSDGRAAAVIGHDWGASVAYALAIRLPELLDRLVILNGVHPAVFQLELAKGGAQAEASQYINWLRRPGSEGVLAADDFGKLMDLFGEGMDLSWMTPERAAAYRAAWGSEAGLRAMVDWYRATPIAVPEPGQPIPSEALPHLDPEDLRVRVPHLLLWGRRDTAFVPEVKDGLGAWCDDLRVVEYDDADHWLAHEKPEEVTAEIRAFLEER